MFVVAFRLKDRSSFDRLWADEALRTVFVERQIQRTLWPIFRQHVLDGMTRSSDASRDAALDHVTEKGLSRKGRRRKMLIRNDTLSSWSVSVRRPTRDRIGSAYSEGRSPDGGTRVRVRNPWSTRPARGLPRAALLVPRGSALGRGTPSYSTSTTRTADPSSGRFSQNRPLQSPCGMIDQDLHPRVAPDASMPAHRGIDKTIPKWE